MAGQETHQNGEGRVSRRRLRTRAALLEAAAACFADKGLAAATVTDITSRADVAYGSFYSHFTGMDELVLELARQSIERIVAGTSAIMSAVGDYRLLAGVGPRVIMRVFLRDPVILWLLDRPQVFAATFRATARPFMLAYESRGIAEGRLNPAGGHEAWIRTLPWLLLSALTDTIAAGDPLGHEEAFARISMRLLGIADGDADALLATSRALVEAEGFGLPELPTRG